MLYNQNISFQWLLLLLLLFNITELHSQWHTEEENTVSNQQ